MNCCRNLKYGAKAELGVLLNKRRKDVRLPYKHGIGNHVDSLAENNLNCGFYQDYLKNTFDIQRFEFESCGYKVTIPDGHHSLHLPFFQTNTSQYCTLYAVCRYGDKILWDEKQLQDYLEQGIDRIVVNVSL